MKPVFLVCLIALVVGTTHAQTKIRFTDPANKWLVIWNHWSGPGTEKLESVTDGWGRDTLYNGHTYKQFKAGYCKDYLLINKTRGYLYLREDTIAGKVYCVLLPDQATGLADTSEHIFYDYNWQLGDTIFNWYLEDAHPDKLPYYYVTQIDSTRINGVYHKAWLFHTDSMALRKEFYVIEGIGSTTDPLFHFLPSIQSDSHYSLGCFEQNGNRPLLNPPIGYFDNAKSCALNIADVRVTQELQIVPHPAHKNSKMILPPGLQTGTIRIMNGMGQVVKTMNFTEQKELAVNQLVNDNGIYHYQISGSKKPGQLSGLIQYED